MSFYVFVTRGMAPASIINFLSNEDTPQQASKLRGSSFPPKERIFADFFLVYYLSQTVVVHNHLIVIHNRLACRCLKKNSTMNNTNLYEPTRIKERLKIFRQDAGVCRKTLSISTNFEFHTIFPNSDRPGILSTTRNSVPAQKAYKG